MNTVWACPKCDNRITTCIPVVVAPVCTQKHSRPGVPMTVIRVEETK